MVTRPQAGFTLVELLVATAITLVALSLAIVLVGPTTIAFQSLPETSDTQQRLRIAVTTIVTDALTAGSGPSLGWGAGAALTWPAVLPCAWNGGALVTVAGGCARPDRLSLIAVAAAAPQGIVAEAMTDPAVPIRIAPLSACALDRSACRLHSGARALVADGTGAWDLFTVTSVSADGTLIGHGQDVFSRAYPSGALVAEATTRAYYLGTDAATGIPQLRRMNGRSADFPLLDHVTALTCEYFGEPSPPSIVNPDDPDRRASTYGPVPPPPDVDDPHDVWPAGENCAFGFDGVHQLGRLSPLPSDASGLALLSPGTLGDGPWCPDAVSANRFDADLLRVRQLRIRIRVQAASLGVRGSLAPWFARPGSAVEVARMVPDLEVHVDVALRNAIR